MGNSSVTLNAKIVIGYIIANIILFLSQIVLVVIFDDAIANFAILGLINLVWGLLFGAWLVYQARIYLCINQWYYFKSNPTRSILYIVLGFLALVLISLSSTAILIHIFDFEIDPQNQQYIVEILNSGAVGFLSMIMYAVILAPIIEELVFRKGVFELITNRFGVVAAIIGNSFLFAFIHVMFEFIDPETSTQYMNILPYFIPGLVISIIYYRSGKLIMIPIIIHILYNAMGIFAIFIEGLF